MRGGLTGGRAASGGVTGGGAASGVMTGGGAASGGMTGGRDQPVTWRTWVARAGDQKWFLFATSCLISL